MPFRFAEFGRGAEAPRPSPSHPSLSTPFPPIRPPPVNNRRRESRLFPAISGKQSERPRRNETKRRLSRMLRTEAAVLAVERKATSAKSTRLWPSAVLQALDDAISGDRWDSALKIFGLLRRQHWYSPKCQTYARLLAMLGRCRQPAHASTLFQTMLSEGLRPTVEVYSSLVGAYGHSGLLNKAFQTIDEMKSVSDCKPDAYTYTILINCCSKLRHFDLVNKLLNEMSFFGIECSSVTYNTIIDGFGKAGMLEEMENSVYDMLETGNCLPDVLTLNSIVWAYGNCGLIDKMEKWCDEFQHMGIEPDVRTFNILIKSYGRAGIYQKMSLVMDFIRKRSFSPTTVTYNLLIESFGKVGNIEEMESYFKQMKFQGIKPNSITYCSLINSYSKAGVLDKVSMIMRQVENSDVFLDTPFFNCVINAYGQAGHVETMKEVFLLMKERKCCPDAITFLTMIHAYNCLGMTEAAKELGIKMCELKMSIEAE